MHVILPLNVAAMAVATIFYTWRAYYAELLKRNQTIRERIAFMLWTAAELAD
jgi:hypothetical protein